MDRSHELANKDPLTPADLESLRLLIPANKKHESWYAGVSSFINRFGLDCRIEEKFCDSLEDLILAKADADDLMLCDDNLLSSLSFRLREDRIARHFTPRVRMPISLASGRAETMASMMETAWHSRRSLTSCGRRKKTCRQWGEGQVPQPSPPKAPRPEKANRVGHALVSLLVPGEPHLRCTHPLPVFAAILSKTRPIQSMRSAQKPCRTVAYTELGLIGPGLTEKFLVGQQYHFYNCKYKVIKLLNGAFLRRDSSRFWRQPRLNPGRSP